MTRQSSSIYEKPIKVPTTILPPSKKKPRELCQKLNPKQKTHLEQLITECRLHKKKHKLESIKYENFNKITITSRTGPRSLNFEPFDKSFEDDESIDDDYDDFDDQFTRNLEEFIDMNQEKQYQCIHAIGVIRLHRYKRCFTVYDSKEEYI